MKIDRLFNAMHSMPREIEKIKETFEWRERAVRVEAIAYKIIGGSFLVSGLIACLTFAAIIPVYGPLCLIGVVSSVAFMVFGRDLVLYGDNMIAPLDNPGNALYRGFRAVTNTAIRGGNREFGSAARANYLGTDTWLLRFFL